MRLLAVLCALFALLPLALAASGTWGIYADPGCAVSLYTATFENGACGAQSSGSGTIYYITTCDGQGNWKETEYSDAQCTQEVAGSTNSGKSGACFQSGDYYGQVVCPKSKIALA